MCIFDQNMNYPDGDVLGTDLCRELRAAGWRGVLLIQSANDSAADAARCRATASQPLSPGGHGSRYGLQRKAEATQRPRGADSA